MMPLYGALEIWLENRKWIIELWKPIPIKGYFEASDNGRIRNRKTGNVLSQKVNGNGYSQCYIGLVHRLVALAWIPNLDDYATQVNHIDEDKQNNRPENLEWMSAKDNVNYGTRSKRAGETMRKQAKLRRDESNVRKTTRLIQ